MQCSDTILLDLKHLLKEAKQRVPHFLLALDDPLEAQVGGRACGCAVLRYSQCAIKGQLIALGMVLLGVAWRFPAADLHCTSAYGLA